MTCMCIIVDTYLSMVFQLIHNSYKEWLIFLCLSFLMAIITAAFELIIIIAII